MFELTMHIESDESGKYVVSYLLKGRTITCQSAWKLGDAIAKCSKYVEREVEKVSLTRINLGVEFLHDSWIAREMS